MECITKFRNRLAKIPVGPLSTHELAIEVSVAALTYIDWMCCESLDCLCISSHCQAGVMVVLASSA